MEVVVLRRQRQRAQRTAHPVATGVSDQLPDVPGVRKRWGQDLLHDPYCHDWEVRDQPLGVLGSNSGSILHAQLVRQWSDDIVYFTHTQEPTPAEATELDARDIRVVHGQVAQVITAADAGSAAAIAINADLVQDDIALAVKGRTVAAIHPRYTRG